MRTTTIVGAALVVLIVAGLIGLSVAQRGSDTTDREVIDGALPTPLATGGQFFQQIPDELTSEPTSPAPTISSGPSPSVKPATATGTTITMSEEGFEPATITVPVGASVSFVNNGQAAHWPASDVHPTHNILPTFDAKPGLTTGETYTYTFSTAGTWRCHDHLMPQFTCTITVTE